MATNIVQVQGLVSNQGIDQADGSVQHLDLDSGHLFDARGNTIARLTPADDYRNQLLADYCSDYDRFLSARAIHQFNPGLAAQLMSNRSSDDALLLTDPIIGGPSDVHVPGALPNYASGYTNFTPLADLISPPLLVDRDTNYFFEFQREDAFQRAIPMTAGVNASVAEISPRLQSSSSYKCVARALGAFVPYEIVANADSPLKVEQAFMRRVINAQKLEREIRVSGKLRTSANWDSATTIAAGYQWNGGASSDPVKDIHTVLDSSSGEPTGIALSGRTYRAYTRNAAVRSYIAYKDSTPGIPDPSALQAQLRLPPFFICEMRYINSSGTLTFVWGNDVVIFRNPAEMPPVSQEDVATSYTFRWRNPPSPDGTNSGGFVVRKFVDQNRGPSGGTKIVCVNYDDEKVTSKYIGNLLINAYQ